MSKFLVEYSLAYEHIVRVGVTASNADEAEAKARAAFDEGIIWDDIKGMPLLYDDFEETDGNVLSFAATEVSVFPPADPSVKASKSHAHLSTARHLLELVKACDMDGVLRREIVEFLEESEP